MAAGQFTGALKEDAQLLVGGADFSDGSSDQLLLRDRNGGWHQIQENRVLPLERLIAKDGPYFLFEKTSLSWRGHTSELTRLGQPG